MCNLHQILEPIPEDILYKDYNYCFTAWKPEPHRKTQLEFFKSISTGGGVFEIGCNDGTFLEALKLEGFDVCVGVEPNPLSGKLAKDKGFDVYQDLLTPEISSDAVQKYGQFDNVVSRHVIEHIPDLYNFFTCVDMILKPGGVIMLDAPDCEAALAMGDASVLWEEHVNYFTDATMKAMLRGFGYKVIDINRYLFTGESLTVIAQKANTSEHEQGEFDINIADIGKPRTNGYHEKMNRYARELREELAARKRKGEAVILFGVGARGTMAVNALGLKDGIDAAFDDQPEKQGMYMPGSGLAICDPNTISDFNRPITCLLAVNNENEEVVMKRLRDLSSQNITFASLFSPKDIWHELATLRG